jgi:hypothetical protein
MVQRTGRIVRWMCAGAFCAMAVVPAKAQSNLDAGKSAAQIFADTCNACHRSPRQLRPTNAMYLRDHYTTGAREAAAMAAYLASVGSDPRAVPQRRPPTQAGTTGSIPAATDRGRAQEGQAAAPGTAAGRKAPAAVEQSSANAATGPAPASHPASESAGAGKPAAEPAPARSADASVLQPGAIAPAETSPLEEFEE